MQCCLFKHMNAEVDFTETAQNFSMWLYKIPTQVFCLFPKGIGGLQAVTGIGKAGTGMQRGKGVGRIDRAGVDIPAYRHKGQLFIAAEEIDMGIAKYNYGIVPMVAQAGVVKMSLFHQGICMFGFGKHLKRKDKLLQEGNHRLRIVCGSFCFCLFQQVRKKPVCLPKLCIAVKRCAAPELSGYAQQDIRPWQHGGSGRICLYGIDKLQQNLYGSHKTPPTYG